MLETFIQNNSDLTATNCLIAATNNADCEPLLRAGDDTFIEKFKKRVQNVRQTRNQTGGLKRGGGGTKSSLHPVLETFIQNHSALLPNECSIAARNNADCKPLLEAGDSKLPGRFTRRVANVRYKNGRSKPVATNASAAQD